MNNTNTNTKILRSIRSWNDLSEYGIDVLTGEACAYSMRLLCDVNEKGKGILERFFGGTITITEGTNWNSGTSMGGAVGSVMLTRSIFSDLAAFILLDTSKEDSSIAAKEDGGAVEYTGGWFTCYGKLGRTYRKGSGPTNGDRNIHAMSGRSV